MEEKTDVELFEEWCKSVGGEVKRVFAISGYGAICYVPLKGGREAAVSLWSSLLADRYSITVDKSLIPGPSFKADLTIHGYAEPEVRRVGRRVVFSLKGGDRKISVAADGESLYFWGENVEDVSGHVLGEEY